VLAASPCSTIRRPVLPTPGTSAKMFEHRKKIIETKRGKLSHIFAIDTLREFEEYFDHGLDDVLEPVRNKLHVACTK
jgi:hypothetical protein